MKNSSHWLSFLLLVFCTATTAPAQDPVKLAPDKCKVLLENARVRVIEIRLKPGEKLGMHSHPATVTHLLSDGKVSTSYPDGRTVANEMKKGQTLWTEPVTHANENTGSGGAHILSSR